MEVPKNLQPRWTAVVPPEEYDIEKEIRQAVRLANVSDGRDSIFVIADIGKLVGLYIAYKEVCEENLTLKIEAGQNNEFAQR